ncbi:hypothetical protein FQN54_009683 [Arachnomyces sp. PD_36]|nr:hypothetical protein FQN54_009683 [Arachnomyces sp. PD_36]
MHSSLTRLQSVFGFFTTVAFVIGGLAAVSVFLHPPSPTANVELQNVQVLKGRPQYYSTKKEEYAQIRFDLEADLTSLFNWNTKQLFVYVLASYPSLTAPSPETPNTESIIWDTIIPAPPSPYSLTALTERYFPSYASSLSKSKKKSTNPKIRLLNQKPKYQITDISGNIAGQKNASLIVGWNVQPWIGALQWNDISAVEVGAGRSAAFDFPQLESKGDAVKG